MKGWGASIAGLWIIVAVATAASTPSVGRAAPASRACCRVAAGTPVEVELVAPVSTKTQASGDTFELRLAEPLIVDGRIVLRAGTPGVGEVIESAGPGMGGKAAKLVLAARYLKLRQGRAPLQGLQMSGVGHDNSRAAQAVGLTGIAFGPLGLVGMAVQGGNVNFPAGMRASAKIAADLTLPSLGRASRSAIQAAADAAAAAEAASAPGAIDLPPPPKGQGQVVFFRRKSLLGTGQWFNVREDGKALGKLTNGAYFVQVADPGLHTYTAKTEPEFKDHLKLKIDPGETYYVEGVLTKGLVMGVADLAPSDRSVFDKVSKDLKLAPPPGGEPSDAASGAPSDASTAAAEAPENRPGRIDSAPTR
jgi:hypothetical protein